MRFSVLALLFVAACRKNAAVMTAPDADADAGRLAANACANAPPIDPTAAVFAAGRLWVATVDGSLISFEPNLEGAFRTHSPAWPIAGLESTFGSSEVVALEHAGDVVRAHRSTGTTWSTHLSVSLPQQRPTGYFDARPDVYVEVGPNLVVARPLEILVFDASGKRVPHRLQSEMLRGELSLATAGKDDFFVGVNRGEFGGGVIRARFDADPEVVWGDPVFWRDGNLISVTGVVIDPLDRTCIYASSGTHHLGLRHGRVVHICHSQTQTIFPRGDVDAGSDDAVFDLAARQDIVLAVGTDSVHRISPSEVRDVPLQPRPQCGLTVVPVEGFWLLRSTAAKRTHYLAVSLP